MFIIVGLGNPGEEYTETRHNVGRMMVNALIKKNKFDELEKDKKYSSLATEGKIGKEKVLVLQPETYMNKSGLALKTLINSKKKAEQLIVIHDDLDLPLGRFKIMFNRGSGGHKGVESVIRSIKTEAFIRIKVGVSPTTPSGKLKKPSSDKVLDFIIGEFKKPELETIKKESKKVVDAIEMIVTDGKEAAMGEFNSH